MCAVWFDHFKFGAESYDDCLNDLNTKNRLYLHPSGETRKWPSIHVNYTFVTRRLIDVMAPESVCPSFENISISPSARGKWWNIINRSSMCRQGDKFSHHIQAMCRPANCVQEEDYYMVVRQKMRVSVSQHHSGGPAHMKYDNGWLVCCLFYATSATGGDSIILIPPCRKLSCSVHGVALVRCLSASLNFSGVRSFRSRVLHREDEDVALMFP